MLIVNIYMLPDVYVKLAVVAEWSNLPCFKIKDPLSGYVNNLILIL